MSRTIWDLFGVCVGVAIRAEKPPEAVDHMRGEAREATRDAGCVLSVHICISGFYDQTEGDFYDLFSLFSSLGGCVSAYAN